MNFSETHSKRRELLKLIRQSQADESAAVKLMCDVAVGYRRTILTIVASWLTELASNDKGYRLQSLGELQSLVGTSVDEWISLSKTGKELAAVADSEAARRNDAESAYYAEAPLGHVTKWTADTTKKLRIGELEQASTAQKLVHERAAANLRQNVTAREVVGRCILADCMRNLDKLVETAAVGEAVALALAEAHCEASKVWACHSSSQIVQLQDVAILVGDLQALYSRDTVSSAIVPRKAKA